MPGRWLVRSVARSLGLACLTTMTTVRPASAGEPSPERFAPAESADPEPPTWRFRRADRPVKVVVLAGSIGAFPRQPYAQRLERICRNVEVKNLAKTGLGAWALKQRFRDQVLRNRNVSAAQGEMWLLFGGGINSIGMPRQTNRHLRDLFVLAHRHDMRVVAFTPTPWGDRADRRWRGASAVRYWRATQQVVDFIMNRSSPAQALGEETRGNSGDADASWRSEELADVAVDLYDSRLRDLDAETMTVDSARAELERDSMWHRDHRRLAPEQRNDALDGDARLLAETPRWFLRSDLRSFDHIHPNSEGHRVIAETACPVLPDTWGCVCPAGP